MAWVTNHNSTDRDIWALVRRQHGVVAAAQLRGFGLTDAAIAHRVSTGRLRRLRRGLYAVGPLALTQTGSLHAAALAAGPRAALSHASAGALYRLMPHPRCPHVTVPRSARVRWDGKLTVHRRVWRPSDVTKLADGLPITTVPRTIVDLCHHLPPAEIEALIDRADAQRLIDPETLSKELRDMGPVHGKRQVRGIVDAASFVATHSTLERRFLPIAKRAGLGKPQTQALVNGHRVDFHWPTLGLVAARQNSDRARDHDHLAAGLLPLRFTYDQVWNRPGYVEQRLAEAKQARG